MTPPDPALPRPADAGRTTAPEPERPEEPARTLMREVRATHGEASAAARDTRAILELLGSGEGTDAAEVILTLIEALAEQRRLLLQIADRLERIETRLDERPD